MDEKNNCLEKTCTSYPVPILIKSGPNVVNITQNSVIVKWVTNKRSDSMVVYSDRSTGEEETVYNAGFVTDHAIRVTGLKPRTTYRFYVASKDQCGNVIISKSRAFETEPAPDEESPSVTLYLPENLSGVVNITASATDNVGVTEVMFLMDAHVKFIDFSPPYLWVCNTTLFSNGDHSFRAVAFDAALNSGFDVKNGTINILLRDVRPPAILILRPHEGQSVSGMVEIETVIQDMALAGERIGHIQRVEIYIDDVLVRSWVYSPFRFNPFRRELVPEAPTSRLTLTHLWNTSGLMLGSGHVIEVKGWDDSGNYGHASINISIATIAWLPPEIREIGKFINVEVTREVVRDETHPTTYVVTLRIRNTGTVTISGLILIDDVYGFQVIPHTASMRVRYYSYHTSRVFFEPDPSVRYPPGGVATIQYFAVPILFNPPIPDDCYIFGWISTDLIFVCDGTPYARSFELEYSPGGNLSSVLRDADYVIVTSPTRLFYHNPDDGGSVNSLLVKMAELARLKRGVLGYLSGDETAEQLKRLISPGGAWASRLAPAFNNPNPEENRDAYVLIVGGTEIVPSYTWNWISPTWSGSVKLCDSFYSDVDGDIIPDLILGRIIGENANAMDLTIPIQTSIDVALGHGFDRSFALGVSGYEDACFAHTVDVAEDVVYDLARQGVPGEALHWSNFVETAWSFHFTYYDASTLGDIDGDGVDEVIIASDEEHMIYIYEPYPRGLVRNFPCEFSRYGGLAAGDLDDDGVDEIVVANTGGRLYVYEPGGTLRSSRDVHFTEWDMLAVGDVEGDGREEIVLISDDSDRVYIYVLNEDNILQFNEFLLDVDFAPHDGFAIGNVRMDWPKSEILVIRYYYQCIYIYNADGRRLDRIEYAGEGGTYEHIHYTRYDGFAAGDINGDGRDEMIVVCDDDKKIYVYYWDNATSKWMWTSYYSRFLNDWFDGIRYTGSPTRHDCVSIGRVIPDENPKLVIIRNWGDTGSFQVLVSGTEWGGPESVDEWANRRVSLLGYSDYPGRAVSFIMVIGHGNPHGASPLWTWYDSYWGYFSQHPFVLSMGCDSGDYESRGYSFSEAFLRHGAGVFVGPTEDTLCFLDEIVAREYFELWDIWNVRAGKAYTIYEKRRCIEPANDPVWALSFNYYGDPKFPTGG